MDSGTAKSGKGEKEGKRSKRSVFQSVKNEKET
jgi:hypothetical protein